MVSHFLCFCCFIMLLLSGCERRETITPVELKQPELEVQAAAKTLARIAKDERPDTPSGYSQHTGSSLDNYIVIEMNRYGNGVAYIARTKAGVHVVHNGSIGKNYQEIDATTLMLSRDGKRVAYGAKSGDAWFVVVDGREYGPFNDKGPAVFSPDSAHVAFEAKEGDSWRIHCDEAVSSTAMSFSDKPVFSSDSGRIMRMENRPDGKTFRLIISDLKFRSIAEHTFNSLNYVADPAGQAVAVIDIHQSKFLVKKVSFFDPHRIVSSDFYDYVLNLSFSGNGKFAFIAKRGSDAFLVVDNREELLPSGEYPWPPVFAADGSVGVIIVGKAGAFAHRAFSAEKISVPGKYKECADLVFSTDGSGHAYVAIKNEQFLIVSNGEEGPVYDRVITPQFSPDGKYLVYRARQNDRRFVVVADLNTGKVLKEHQRYERVFETAFTADGKAVAYGIKDGDRLMWKVERLEP